MSELTDFTASVVVVGSLNPLIFSPEWLHSAGAIGPDESAAARTDGIEVMAPNITSIKFGSMKLIVEQGRFVLTVSDEPLIRAKDFSAICFRLLSHTPVIAMGLNYDATLKTTDLDKWNEFGDVLAPKPAWGDFLTAEDQERLGGLRGMTMERKGAPGGGSGHIRCILQVAEGVNGQASVEINNHFVLAEGKNPGSGAEVYKIIENQWDDVFEQSVQLIKRVQGIADAA